MGQGQNGQLEGVLRRFTNHPKTLAEFFEATGRKEDAQRVHLELFDSYVASKWFEAARDYAEKHNLLSAQNKWEFARRWCEAVLEAQPWDALKIARQFGLVDLGLRAATARSERILEQPGCDEGPALDIARLERSAEPDYRRRAARYAFAARIERRQFDQLPELVAEFNTAFDDDERELAAFLSEMTRA